MKTGRLVRGIKTERDIFKILNIPYKSPEERSHKGKEYELLTKLAKKKPQRKERAINVTKYKSVKRPSKKSKKSSKKSKKSSKKSKKPKK
jgi:hypothetical protein